MFRIFREHTYGQGEHPPPPMDIMNVSNAKDAKDICGKLNVSLHGEGFEYTSWDNPRFDYREVDNQ